MKRLLRLYIVSLISIWLVNWQFPEGLVLTGGQVALLKASAGLMLALMVAKPILHMIMLPLNLVTFGLFRWVVNVAVLWLVVTFVGGVSIQAFSFPGINLLDFHVPAMSFNYWMAWIVISLMISIISGLLNWLME